MCNENLLEPFGAYPCIVCENPIVSNSHTQQRLGYWPLLERGSVNIWAFQDPGNHHDIGKSLSSIYLIYCAHTCKSLQRLEHRNSSSNHRELQQFARTKPGIFLLMWKYATDRQFGDGSYHFQQIQVLLSVEAYISSMYPQANGSNH